MVDFYFNWCHVTALFYIPAVRVNCRSQAFHIYRYYNLVQPRVKDKRQNEKDAKTKSTKIDEKSFLYYRSLDTNQNDLFYGHAPLGIKFVSYLSSLFSNSHWLDSNACPSQFLRHDSYTPPALFDCLKLLVTNDSSVYCLRYFFKRFHGSQISYLMYIVLSLQ